MEEEDDPTSVNVTIDGINQDQTLSIGKVTVARRAPTLPELVPDPVFF